MKLYNVAVLGATGAVGQEMVKALMERQFPVGELRLLSGKRSAGRVVDFCGKSITVMEADENAFDGMDIVLSSVESEVVRHFAPFIKKAGAVLIDNSSTFRLERDVPLVVPEINPEAAKKHNGIIANPNCTTIITLMAVYAIARLSKIVSMTASSYQAVSGAGIDGLNELCDQCRASVVGDELKVNVFRKQIFNNVIPKIGDVTENGYTTEEMKLQNESRKILDLPEMKVSCTCVRVPVMRSHSISVSFSTEREITVQEAREAVKNANGCVLCDDAANEEYPTPLMTSDQDKTYVGRIRRDIARENGLSLWCCGDQLRKGAAVNAVQIAELLTK